MRSASITADGILCCLSCHDLQRAMYFISFSTNLFATGFIIAKAWCASSKDQARNMEC